MSPTLENGDYILIKNPRSQIKLRPGFIYVLNHERLGRLVKRLDKVTPEGLWVSGDNPRSTSSEKIGIMSPDAISGRALWVVSPKGLHRLRA